MSKGGAVVLEKALALPPDERAELVDRLLSSLSAKRERRIEELWAREAEDRLAAFDRGEIKAVSVQDVLKPKKARSRDR
jgi:putative addiction module component (TIGR02574 family)